MSIELWNKALEIMELDSRISTTIFDNIIKKIKPIKYQNGLLILSCRDEYSKGIITSNEINSLIQGAVSLVADGNVKLSFIVGGDDTDITTVSIAEKKVIDNTVKSTSKTNIISSFTFDNFVVGDCNRFANAASIQVADKPGQSHFNPLFIWGNSGLGKTHLMHAIGNRALEKNPNLSVIYTTCEQFTTDYISCINSKQFEPFRNRYRTVDILLIDDIQFLINKEGTQQEFFNTFEALINAGKQIVITSDKAPSNLTTLDERLTSRFQNGYTMDVQPPDYETRKAIFLKKSESDEITIDPEITNYICENSTDNIRSLNGAYNIVTSVIALSNKVDITLSDVKVQLDNFFSPNKRQTLTYEIVINKVSQYFEISPEKIVSNARNRDILVARNTAMYLCREYLDLPLKKIGMLFGGRDHATVMHSIEKVSSDDSYNKHIEEIKKMLPL